MNKELISALIEFKQAYNNLAKEWIKDDTLFKTKSIELYPFKQSYDELEVNKWIDNTITELEEGLLEYKIMVVGYNSYDEDKDLTYIIDFVDTVEEAEAKEDILYHEEWVYTDFLDCYYEDGKYYFEGEEYKIGDVLL